MTPRQEAWFTMLLFVMFGFVFKPLWAQWLCFIFAVIESLFWLMYRTAEARVRLEAKKTPSSEPNKFPPYRYD